MKSTAGLFNFIRLPQELVRTVRQAEAQVQGRLVNNRVAPVELVCHQILVSARYIYVHVYTESCQPLLPVQFGCSSSHRLHCSQVHSDAMFLEAELYLMLDIQTLSGAFHF